MEMVAKWNGELGALKQQLGSADSGCDFGTGLMT